MSVAEISELRGALTKTSQPMSVVLADVAKLEGQYRLVIVSAASEAMVNGVLIELGIGMFSYVFGRNPHRDDPEWSEVETKSQLFIRLSNMLGIPLERMIFVGDSDADFRSARQLRMPFIENRLNAEECGVVSLITSSTSHDVISGRLPGELINKVNEIERRMLERWRRI